MEQENLLSFSIAVFTFQKSHHQKKKKKATIILQFQGFLGFMQVGLTQARKLLKVQDTF